MAEADWLKDLPDDLNPYAMRLRQQPALGTVSLGQRFEANTADSLRRGTLAGSADLLEMQRISTMTPQAWADYSKARQSQDAIAAGGFHATPQELSPPAILTPAEAQTELDRIRAEAARYETMPGFEGPLEGAVALAGQLAGGMQSPESWITRLPGTRQALGRVFGEAADTVAGRILEAGLSQGAINTAVDPLAQQGGIATGIQPEGYDPIRTALAFPVGAPIGGTLQGAGEAIGGAVRRRAGARSPEAERAALAIEDPALRSPESLTTPETPPEPGNSRTTIEINGERTVIEGPIAPSAAAAPKTWETLTPADFENGRMLRLYRGETAGGQPIASGAPGTGGWFTTDPAKAARYGDVSYVDVTLDELRSFARGHGGPDEFLTTDPAISSRAQPLPANTAAEPAGTPEPVAAPMTAATLEPPPPGPRPEAAAATDSLDPFAGAPDAPRAFPVVEDAMLLMQRGELSAERAKQIGDQLKAHFEGVENEIFGADDAARLRRLHRQSEAAWNRADDARANAIDAEIAAIEARATPDDMAHLEGRGAPDQNIDPEGWHQLAQDLRDVEQSRESAVNVFASRLRDLPNQAPITSSEREAIAVIGRAMQAESERGGSVAQLLSDAAKERFDRYGGGANANELVGDQLGRLQELMKNPPAEAAQPPRLAAAKASTVPPLLGEPIAAIPPHRVATATGESVDVAPVVVEARDLKASADPGYDPALQPRQRDRAAAEQQVREIASGLEPERLGFSAEADRGAPIIGDDGMVESGNGRVMAIRQAYAEGGEAAQRYRDWLASQGVDVARYEQPVLVRQRVTPLDPQQRQAFAIAANRPATLALSAPERALADSQSITPDMLDLIRNPDDLGAVANRDFVRAFVDKLPQTEQGMLATAEGGLSAEGLARVRNAVLARAYGDAALLARIAEATHDEVRLRRRSGRSCAPTSTPAACFPTSTSRLNCLMRSRAPPTCGAKASGSTAISHSRKCLTGHRGRSKPGCGCSTIRPALGPPGQRILRKD